MPTYIYSCPNRHSFEKFKKTPYKRVRRYRCKICGMWATRDYAAEHATSKKDIHLDYENDPISHLATKRSFRGITIENLTPEPVFVRDKTQYEKLLNKT